MSLAVSKGIALITGASQGIGRAISLRLARDGFDIALNDLPSGNKNLETLKREIADMGRKSYAINGDVSSEKDVKAVVEGVVGAMGGLDVMVANAGICIGNAVVDTPLEEWERHFAINGRGVFLCYKYAAQQMIKQGRGGRIIAASSVVGKQAEARLGAYSASKFAVRGLTQSLAKELGPYGITVNAYAPGTIDTPLLKNLGMSLEGEAEFYDAEAKKTVLGRNGVTDDISNVVSFLASKDANFITGQSISVNGGRYFD